MPQLSWHSDVGVLGKELEGEMAGGAEGCTPREQCGDWSECAAHRDQPSLETLLLLLPWELSPAQQLRVPNSRKCSRTGHV